MNPLVEQMLNPLVEQMLNTQHRNDLELEILEQTFEHRAECQSRSHLLGCTEDVTHLFISSHRQVNVCSDTVAYVKDSQQDPRNYCETCGESTRLCWTIRPI